MIPNKIRRGQERAKFDFSLRLLHSWPRFALRSRAADRTRNSTKGGEHTVAKGMGMKKEKKKPKKKK
jgi:hypothetical protein